MERKRERERDDVIKASKLSSITPLIDPHTFIQGGCDFIEKGNFCCRYYISTFLLMFMLPTGS